MSDNDRQISITHIIIEESFQWIIGRNVTNNGNIDHIERNALGFHCNGILDSITLRDHEFLLYVPMSRF